MQSFEVVRITTNLCYENNGALLSAVTDTLVGGPPGVLLDLSEVCAADSSGVRSLLRAKKACEEAGASLRIGGASDCVARILAMSGLAPVFGLPTVVWDSVRDALPAPLDLEQAKWRIYEHIATSDPYVISVLRDRATEAAVEAGATGDALCDIQISAGEALTNAYKHGSPTKGVNKIIMRCMTCPQAVAIEVEDEGEPFDPDAIPIPDPDDMRDHGMGIYLMRQAMDVVEFTHDCPGNRVRMIKWLMPS